MIRDVQDLRYSEQQLGICITLNILKAKPSTFSFGLKSYQILHARKNYIGNYPKIWEVYFEYLYLSTCRFVAPWKNSST